jgi:hypothetical protein
MLLLIVLPFLFFTSAATDQVTTHTFAAAISTKQRRANVTARATARMRGVITATVALRLHIQSISRRSVFGIGGIHCAGDIDHPLSVNKISALDEYTSHQIVPFCGAIAFIDRI